MYVIDTVVLQWVSTSVQSEHVLITCTREQLSLTGPGLLSISPLRISNSS